MKKKSEKQKIKNLIRDHLQYLTEDDLMGLADASMYEYNKRKQ